MGIDHERAGSHGVPAESVGVGLICRRRGNHPGSRRERLREVAVGFAENELDGQGVKNVHFLDVGDDATLHGTVVGVHDFSDVEHDCRGVERGAVRELDPIPQRHPPGDPVLGRDVGHVRAHGPAGQQLQQRVVDEHASIPAAPGSGEVRRFPAGDLKGGVVSEGSAPLGAARLSLRVGGRSVRLRAEGRVGLRRVNCARRRAVAPAGREQRHGNQRQRRERPPAAVERQPRMMACCVGHHVPPNGSNPDGFSGACVVGLGRGVVDLPVSVGADGSLVSPGQSHRLLESFVANEPSHSRHGRGGRRRAR